MNAHHTHARPTSAGQLVAVAVAAMFLAVGALGFVPGVTASYDGMTLAGHESKAELLGIFQVSVLHNLVHVLFGIVGLALARTRAGAVGFLVGGGVVYLGLWVYGELIEAASEANFVPVNAADNWLHLGLGAGMILLGGLPATVGRRWLAVRGSR